MDLVPSTRSKIENKLKSSLLKRKPIASSLHNKAIHLFTNLNQNCIKKSIAAEYYSYKNKTLQIKKQFHWLDSKFIEYVCIKIVKYYLTIG